MTAYAEVIGDPIAHSRSPEIHTFWLEALGIAANYRRERVSEAALTDHVARRRPDRDWRGSNVTMPLKRAALDLADGASDRAIAASAANILIPKDGKIFAANTDVGAIATLIDAQRKAGRAATTITVFGSGGAARGALVALKLLGIDQVRVQARDLHAARKLTIEFGLGLEPLTLVAPVDTDVLINATPLGMAGFPCLNCDLAGLASNGFVFDMVTNPPLTSLIAAAGAADIAAISGLDMLIEQAATSFKLLFGKDAPRDRDPELRERLAR